MRWESNRPRNIPNNLDIFVQRGSPFDSIRSNHDVLARNNATGCSDLREKSVSMWARRKIGTPFNRQPPRAFTYQHVCTDRSIDIVHKDVKLIQATQR